jgi:hypothetical protein
MYIRCEISLYASGVTIVDKVQKKYCKIWLLSNDGNIDLSTIVSGVRNLILVCLCPKMA